MINKDLRLIYLYEFKRGTNATETARNINEAFGDKSAEVRTVQRWFARFRNGDESCMVKQYHGRKRKFNHFFKHLDAFLKDKQFETQTDAETAFQTFLDSRSDDFYKKGIDDIVPRWHKCIQSYGAYFD